MNKTKTVTTETETAARPTRRNARPATELPTASATLEELQQQRRAWEREARGVVLESALRFYQMDALPRDEAEESLRKLVFRNWLQAHFHGQPFPILVAG